MKLYDTHAHFEEDDDVEAIYDRARACGVAKILAVGGSAELNRNALRTPGRVALGWDRDQTDVDRNAHPDNAVKALATLCRLHKERLAAIGEIGLDGHYNPETLAAQCHLFAAELAFADQIGRPVIIHTREADDATLGVLDEVPWQGRTVLRGIIHSFTGTPAFARQLLDRGFAISFSGIATFNRAENVRESARYVPNDRILIETDSPFLSPVPLRGKRCEPAFVVHTAERIARERNTNLETFAAFTYANAERLLG